jgi:hypothetical protein
MNRLTQKPVNEPARKRMHAGNDAGWIESDIQKVQANAEAYQL